MDGKSGDDDIGAVRWS